MAHFRKKPVIVEAMQYLGIPVDNVSKAVEFDDWLCKVQNPENPCRYVGHKLILPQPTGQEEANPGDWVIRGAFSLYACSADEFEKLFETVDPQTGEPDFEDLPEDPRTVSQQAVDTLRQ